MRVLLHADDYGNSRTITDSIIDCLNGALTGTSIIPNGYAFDYAMKKFSSLHPDKILRVHLNLIEGPVCCNKRNTYTYKRKGIFQTIFYVAAFFILFSFKKKS